MNDMKNYLAIIYEGISDELEFVVFKTNAEQGTEDFENIIEDMETNHSNIIIKQIDEQLLKEVDTLKSKMENPQQIEAN